MKRNFCGILVFVLLLALLTACGSGSGGITTSSFTDSATDGTTSDETPVTAPPEPEFKRPADITLISLNVRTASSPTVSDHGYTQVQRKLLIQGFVLENMPDSFSTQECEVLWRDTFDSLLTGYKRAQENTTVTKNYIWYNTETTECSDAGVFWLSETPEESSKGFGSNYYISCCWALLKNKATGAEYVHMNTHLDVNSEETRKKEIAVLLERAKQFSEQGYAVLITGDFNSLEDSVIYASMTADVFSDIKYQTADDTTIGTFNDFVDSEVFAGPIDFCFGNSEVKATKYSVIPKWNGTLMSDHNALSFKITIYGD